MKLCAQAALAYWSVVSPFSPYGPTIALVVILVVAAIKALIEDAARHREDVKTNNGHTRLLHSDGIALGQLPSSSHGVMAEIACSFEDQLAFQLLPCYVPQP